MKFDCEFLFAVLAEKHNAVIRKIREIPPWEVPDGLYKPIAPNPLTLPGNANQTISFPAPQMSPVSAMRRTGVRRPDPEPSAFAVRPFERAAASADTKVVSIRIIVL